MSRGIGQLCAWAGLAALGLATAAVGEPLPKPPKTPNEVVGVTANGCGIVFVVSADASAAARQALKTTARGMRWNGPCRFGLAHGRGSMTVPPANGMPEGRYEAEYFYGRTPYIIDLQTRTVSLSSGGRFASASFDSELDNPVWGALDAPLGTGTGIAVPGVQVNAVTMLCPIDVNSYAPLPPGCAVYAVQYIPEGDAWNGGRETPCPTPRSPGGCEGVWRQVAGPYIATYRAMQREFEASQGSWRAMYTQMNAARDARFAVIETAAGQAFDKALIPAAAQGAQANRSFEAKLAAGSAGELYALADELQRAGDTDKAGQTLRALLRRFPNHPLAVTAAQQLSSLPAGQAPVRNDCAAAAEADQVGAAVSSAMSRIPAGNPAWRYEAVLAGLERAGAAWARCPASPAISAKIRTYRTAYIETAAKCAMISPTGACTPNLH